MSRKKKKKKPIAKPRVKRSATQLAEDLQRQIRFLRNSARLFDDGEIDEACRIATAIRVLVYDKGKSKSLLFKLMDIKDLSFYDTALSKSKGSLSPYHGLVGMELSPKPKWVWLPHCFGSKEPAPTTPRIQFDSWWNSVVLQDNQGVLFTRKDIVLALCNQDGGAHVDPEIDDQYERLEKAKEFAYQFGSGNKKTTPVAGAGQATVRQLGYEVMLTLKDKFPEYFVGIYLQPERVVLGPNASAIAAFEMFEAEENSEDDK